MELPEQIQSLTDGQRSTTPVAVIVPGSVLS
ncbi:hypothetical protein BOCO_0580 [Bombiscardovia coagulans]|uniref:Uncharacterized protein n=1 Tax=Bombiscardovia coagulans TaxID=686666 RepID=A0A261ET89_9BIFI|nr:hypothetical protein BOCO_0580 [Bombiscardovia coagulans]